jgi:hypothetical protein
MTLLILFSIVVGIVLAIWVVVALSELGWLQ